MFSGRASMRFWETSKSARDSRPPSSSGSLSILFSDTSRHSRLFILPISWSSESSKCDVSFLKFQLEIQWHQIWWNLNENSKKVEENGITDLLQVFQPIGSHPATGLSSRRGDLLTLAMFLEEMGAERHRKPVTIEHAYLPHYQTVLKDILALYVKPCDSLHRPLSVPINHGTYQSLSRVTT